MPPFSKDALETISSWAEILTAAFGILAAASAVVYLLSNKPLRKIEAHESQLERQAAARAKKEAAEAQLALQKHLESVVKHQKDRELNSRNFVKLLEGKPKKAVELLYNPNDDEAYRFAMQIYKWLGVGGDEKGAGWNVSPPKPIPPNAGYQDLNFSNAPPGMRFGGSGSATGITFRARNISGDSDRATPLGALVHAIGFSLGGHAAFVIENDPSLSD